MTGRRRASQAKFTSMAKGQLCMIRVPDVCCGDPQTSVPCHLRMPGLSGFGFIADPIFWAIGCHTCHAWCDSHHDDATRVMFYQGIFRTQQWLYKRGVLVLEAA